MRDGFVRVAAVTPGVKTADIYYNKTEIVKRAKEASIQGAKVIVFPELCLTGADCRDLFYQESLLYEAERALFYVAKETEKIDAIIFVGLPLCDHGNIYNTVAAISHGTVLGLVPKTRIPHDSHSEGRPFSDAPMYNKMMVLGQGETVTFGTKQLFSCMSMPMLTIGIEIGEDFYLADEPAMKACQNGAEVMVVPSACAEGVSSQMARRIHMLGQSGRFHAAYIFAGAGRYESTTDSVCAGARLIAEDGDLLGEGDLYTEGMLLSEVDVAALYQQRLSDSLFTSGADEYDLNFFTLEVTPSLQFRNFNPLPFVPEELERNEAYCKDVFDIQVHGLMKRLSHTHAKKALVGVSGGLDSTLALLVAKEAMLKLGKEASDVIAITMPGFGTTNRTYENAVSMIKELGATFREISIKDACIKHFEDIGQPLDCYDTTYENAQARERTQILMDVANRENGLVVGTGDLSELALGWATYNGDHMSMYAVNAAVSKTLIRFVIRYYIEAFAVADSTLAETLLDVIDTPVSPELVPSDTGEITQKTEEKVGPYELSDFYLYYCLGYGFGPGKIYRMAVRAFEGTYSKNEVAKWLRVFYERFFTQQYKRSCLPDGPGIGLVGVSPRGTLRMPSDAVFSLWKEELESRLKP